MKTHILIILLVGVLSFVFISCEHPVEPPEPVPVAIRYDTLSLKKGRHWYAFITHARNRDGDLYAHLGISGLIDTQQDSIPYGGYNVMLAAETSDTLLPLGLYTTQSADLRCILNKNAYAFGAETDKWYKEGKRFDFKDVAVQIGKDTTQNYYLDVWAQMKSGENLYFRCSQVLRHFRDENNKLIEETYYYPDDPKKDEYYVSAKGLEYYD